MVPRGLSFSWDSIPGQALTQECAMAPTAHRSDRSPQALCLEFQALLQTPASLPRTCVHRPDCTHQPCTFPSWLQVLIWTPQTQSTPGGGALSASAQGGRIRGHWLVRPSQAGRLGLGPRRLGSKACPYCLPLSREPQDWEQQGQPRGGGGELQRPPCPGSSS